MDVNCPAWCSDQFPCLACLAKRLSDEELRDVRVELPDPEQEPFALEWLLPKNAN